MLRSMETTSFQIVYLNTGMIQLMDIQILETLKHTKSRLLSAQFLDVQKLKKDFKSGFYIIVHNQVHKTKVRPD